MTACITAAEQAYCLRKRKAAESLAARFAAKEAGAKALGTGISRGVNWLEIEVVREPGGRPTLRFHGRAAEIAAALGVVRAALSLTHTAELAMASVCLKTGDKPAPSAILKALKYDSNRHISASRGMPCQAAKRFSGRN